MLTMSARFDLNFTSFGKLIAPAPVTAQDISVISASITVMILTASFFIYFTPEFGNYTGAIPYTNH